MCVDKTCECGCSCSGARGPRGLQGERGEIGETGVQGIQGVKGIQGDDGVDGRILINSDLNNYEVAVDPYFSYSIASSILVNDGDAIKISFICDVSNVSTLDFNISNLAATDTMTTASFGSASGLLSNVELFFRKNGSDIEGFYKVVPMSTSLSGSYGNFTYASFFTEINKTITLQLNEVPEDGSICNIVIEKLTKI